MLLAGPAFAQPYAFVTDALSPERGLYVVDLASHTVERRIVGVGDEPSALQLSPDRTRLYVSSWRSLPNAQQANQVYVIDTRTRTVIGNVTVGQAQSRAIALSPDGAVLYAWALALSPGPDARQLVRLNAATLQVIGALTLPMECHPQMYNGIRAHPDGRVMLVACPSGLRWFDPQSQTLVDAPGSLGGRDVLGFSANGGEVYLDDDRTPIGLQSRLTALDLGTGVDHRFTFALPAGQPQPGSSSRPRRMLFVQRPGDPPATPTPMVLFGSSGPLGFAQILARASFTELQQPATPSTRRLLATTTLLTDGGTAPQGLMAATDDGSRLYATGASAMRINTASYTQDGPALALPGVGDGVSGDVVIVPFPFLDAIFADDFELP